MLDIAQLLERLAALERRVIELEAENAELRRRLGLDSTNSHKPPSQDPPAAQGKRKASRAAKRASGRKRGGQPGHDGRTRVMVVKTALAHVEEVRPTACTGCGASLDAAPVALRPERHQVAEVPVVRPEVTEYRLHACICPGCGTRNKASLPRGVNLSRFGPRLHALVGHLSGVSRMSRRNIQAFLKDFCGLSVSLGAISEMERRMSHALSEPVDAVVEAIRKGDAPVGMDETGWREAGERRWLWVMATRQLAAYVVRRSRGGQVVEELLGPGGAGGGTKIVDRWSAYHLIPLEKRQLCWSHLLRDFQAMAEAQEPLSATVGRRLLRYGAQMFRRWHQFKADKLSWEKLQRKLHPMMEPVERLLKQGVGSKIRKTAGTCRHILDRRAAMWTFTRTPEVEPTNNDSERALRHAVLWRASSLGTQSARGARFTERVLSTMTTLRKQRRPVFAFLAEAMRSLFHRRAGPSLLPMAAEMAT